MKYLEVEFDDFVMDDIGTWSQICTNCLKKFTQFYAWDEQPLAGIICGIKECNNEAEYYLDFKYEKNLDKARINVSL